MKDVKALMVRAERAAEKTAREHALLRHALDELVSALKSPQIIKIDLALDRGQAVLAVVKVDKKRRRA